MTALPLKQRFQLSRFVLGEKAQAGEITLNQRRIFILPTQRGLNFVVLIGLLLLIAFVYNNNLAYLLGFLLASVFFIAILHSYRSLAGLTVRAGQTTDAFAGESAGFEIRLTNPTPVARSLVSISLENTETLALAADSITGLTLYKKAAQRGVLTAGTITIASTYPLGLFRAWSPLRFDMKALIYPKPAPASSPIPEAYGEQTYRGQLKKGVDDFYGLNAYQPGDAIRHIHWKAFAKGQGLLSKQYGSEHSGEIWLDYQQTAGHNLEERLSQLCRWLLDAEQTGLHYGLKLPGLSLEPGHGQAHLTTCLAELARF